LEASFEKGEALNTRRARWLTLGFLALTASFTMRPAETQTAPAADVLRPALVAISVPNLSAAVHWYVDILGFKILKQAAFPDYKMSLAILERDDFRLELVELQGSSPAGKLLPGIDNPALIQGFGKLAFSVQDLDAWEARLKSKGVRFQLKPREDREEGTKSFIVLDDSGNWIQFTSKLTPAK